MLFDKPGFIGSGGNSGFQALNLVAQFGAKRIILVGFDMHAARGLHWYGPNRGRNMRNPKDTNYVRWRKALSDQATLLNKMGIEVINTSTDSALVCFPHRKLDATWL